MFLGVLFQVIVFILLKTVKKMPKIFKDWLQSTHDQFVFNGFLGFFTDNFLIFTIGICIQLQNTQLFGKNFNTIFAVLMAVCLVATPVFQIWFGYKYYDKLLVEDSKERQLVGDYIQELNAKKKLAENVSEVIKKNEDFKLSKTETLMFSILPLARKLFITLVVVFYKELPAIQISLLSIKQLMFVIFLVWYKPYAIKQRNLDEIRNELLIMIYLMLTRIYTPWVTDVQVRNQA